MKYSVKTTKWNKFVGDGIVFFVDCKNWEKELLEIDREFDKQLIKTAKADNFTAGEGAIYTLPTYGKIEATFIVLVGIGAAKDFDLYTLRKVAALLSKYARNLKKETLALDLSFEIIARFAPQDVGRTIVEGMNLGGYSFSKYKKNNEVHPLKQVVLLTNAARLGHLANGIAEGALLADATVYARDLINEPAQTMTPAYLAAQAKQLAKLPGITVQILEKKEIEKLGMNAFLSVAQGSSLPPKFIKLEYKGGRKKVVIVGKAITFDTGGHSLKDAKNMETMKLDMAGGAAILGVFSALSKLKPKMTVVGLIAACENMVGPNATKPGDIVRAMNGTSIEVLNTDAEGRLTLADVLSYAVQEKPEAIVDLATLTGACVVALGEDIAGLFANDQKLTHALIKSGEAAGEKLWPMPLEKEYRDLIKGDIADLRNIAKNRYGGAVTAALFLEEFVAGIPWAHADIAGPAFVEKETPVVPKGASGFGVRTLLEWLKNIDF